MAELITMPKMSDTMTEGVIVKWNVKVGDAVKSGDIIAEVETDKRPWIWRFTPRESYCI